MKFEILKLIKSKKNNRTTNSYLQPTILVFSNFIRIYFGSRDKNGVSRVAFLDIKDLNKIDIINESKEFALDIGSKGCFDDNGVVPTFAIKNKNNIDLLYAGYQIPSKTKFLVFTGMAQSNKKGKVFKRNYKKPYLDRSEEGLLFNVIHFIYKKNNQKYFFYGYGNNLIGNTPSYQIGIKNNKFEKLTSIKLNKSKKEIRVARPNLVYFKKKYLLFFCVSTTSSFYHIEYAESLNLKNWKRKGKIQFIGSKNLQAECNKMQAYPYVLKSNDILYIFYNGNNFGQNGILVAKLII